MARHERGRTATAKRRLLLPRPRLRLGGPTNARGSGSRGAAPLSPAGAALDALRLERRDAPPVGWERWQPAARGATFATTAGWFRVLAESFPDVRLRLLAAYRGERLAGAFPFFEERRWRRSWVRSMPFGTHGGPLVAPEEAEPGAVRGALAGGFRAWAGEIGVAGGEIVQAAETAGGDGDPALAALTARTVRGRSHVIDLAPGPETILAGLERETRRGLRRAAEAGVEVREAPEALAAVHEMYLEQAREWGVARPYPLSFLERLLADDSGFARHLVAFASGRPVAGAVVLRGGPESFVWWSGASAESRPLLAYPVLMLSAMERAAAAGAGRLNIGSSGGRERLERFKGRLGAEPWNVWVYVLGPSRLDPLGRLLSWLRAARRRV